MINRQENHVYGLNQGVLHEVMVATEGAIAEVCHFQGSVCSRYVNDFSSAVVTYVLTGISTARDRFNPMHKDDFADENVQRATAIIAKYLRHICNDRGRVSRLARIMSLVDQQAA